MNSLSNIPKTKRRKEVIFTYQEQNKHETRNNFCMLKDSESAQSSTPGYSERGTSTLVLNKKIGLFITSREIIHEAKLLKTINCFNLGK